MAQSFILQTLPAAPVLASSLSTFLAGDTSRYCSVHSHHHLVCSTKDDNAKLSKPTTSRTNDNINWTKVSTRRKSRIGGRQGSSNTLTAREARARKEARRSLEQAKGRSGDSAKLAELQAAAASAAVRQWRRLGKRGLLDEAEEGQKLSEEIVKDVKFLKSLVGPVEGGLPFKLDSDSDEELLESEPAQELVKAAVQALEEVSEEMKDGVKLEFEEEEEKSPMIEGLIQQLEDIRMHALELEKRNAAFFENTHEQYRDSARNLLHYLALRSSDIRDLQGSLKALGLSSLGRSEANTMASIDAVLKALKGMQCCNQLCTPSASGDMVPNQNGSGSRSRIGSLPSLAEGQAQLRTNTEALLGERPQARKTRIMVTMPASAATDTELVRNLLAVGMDVARVNCAHDDAVIWGQIVSNVQKCSQELGRECRIFMDLAGPKLRTGSLQAGPRVAYFGPNRDVRGRVTRPAKIFLGPPGAHPPHGADCDLILPVEPSSWTKQLKVGDVVCLRDTRDKVRELIVVSKNSDSCFAECSSTTYVEVGTELAHESRSNNTSHETKLNNASPESPRSKAKIVNLPAIENPIVLMQGDRLVLTAEPAPGVPAALDEEGNVKSCARIACTLPEVFMDVKKGQLIKLDDGKIEGVIEDVSSDEIRVEIRRAKSQGSKLRSDKAINLPETNLHVRGLTPKDIADLDFIAVNADMVGFSFVNEPEDVASLQEELAKRDAQHVGIVLKIETKRGFQKLPWLLLQCMRTSNPIGVMIARGDLAVECGWERLAEIQEEILWLCEAAHVPTVWATQVLEGLAKVGLPSRAEITDAAMGERAECVMLNKGPHIVLAVTTLHDILRRMHSHQVKKQSMLRSLKISLPFNELSTVAS